MADTDKRIEALEDELKLVKGEIKRTLVDLRAKVMQIDAPFGRRPNEQSAIRETPAPHEDGHPHKIEQMTIVDRGAGQMAEPPGYPGPGMIPAAMPAPQWVPPVPYGGPAYPPPSPPPQYVQPQYAPQQTAPPPVHQGGQAEAQALGPTPEPTEGRGPVRAEHSPEPISGPDYGPGSLGTQPPPRPIAEHDYRSEPNGGVEPSRRITRPYDEYAPLRPGQPIKPAAEPHNVSGPMRARKSSETHPVGRPSQIITEEETVELVNNPIREHDPWQNGGIGGSEMSPENLVGTHNAIRNSPNVNLVSNLVRWAALAQERLGSPCMESLLELYFKANHESPGIQEMIAHIVGMLRYTQDSPGDSQGEPSITMQWNDLMLQLHGILTWNCASPNIPSMGLGKLGEDGSLNNEMQ